MDISEKQLLPQVQFYILSRYKYCLLAQDFLSKSTVLFEDESISGKSLHKYVAMRIRALNLYGFEVNDILLEAIIRGLAMITNHREPINNPPAWLRVTANHILLEEVRKIKGHYQLSDELLERIDFSYSETGVPSNDNFARAVEAFRGLSESDRRIIMYKLLQGKNYREINQLSTYVHCSEAALRQKYTRAVKNLRANFCKLSLSALL
jgi:DNA-directed RNA polymerase specialized sigma24 family protein